MNFCKCNALLKSTKVSNKNLENLLDCKEIKQVNPKENQPWIFTGRTDADVEAPILWPPDVKSWLIRKDPDAGKAWGQRRRGWQRMRLLDSITNATNMNSGKLREMVRDREAWHTVVHGVAKSGHNWATEQQQKFSSEQRVTSTP